MRDIYFAQHFLVPTLFLCVASALDFSKGKFPNFVFLISLCFSVVWVYALTGSFFAAAQSLAFGFACLVILFPLFSLGALGAGDIKLMSVFCVLTSWQITASVLVYSLFWGLCIGVISMALSGQLKTFFISFYLRTPQHYGRIPYAVALLLGWLSVSHAGGIL